MQLCVRLFSLLWCIQVTQYSFCCTEVAKSYTIVVTIILRLPVIYMQSFLQSLFCYCQFAR